MAKKENALDLAKLIDKGVRVKLSGGREGETLSLRHAVPCHTKYFRFIEQSENVTLNLELY